MIKLVVGNSLKPPSVEAGNETIGERNFLKRKMAFAASIGSLLWWEEFQCCILCS